MENERDWDFNDEQWIDLGVDQPEPKEPCYYMIEVICRGWYDPDDNGSFKADSASKPEAHTVAWQPWITGKTLEEKIMSQKNLTQGSYEEEK